MTAAPPPASHPIEYHLEYPMNSSTAIATQEPTIVADELVINDGIYGRTELARIRISPDNRKRFNPQKLQELADSIKAVGVAQPILIRPVNPTELEPQDFEIVAGERRYRASIMAGLVDIPAMVRLLTDVQAAKLRILENLQREDPHPMEEAEGYQQLMLKHGYSADQLADEIKKSRSYVFGRLKLCSLTTEVREQFLDEKLSASTALLIARIPLPALQVKALGEILKPQYGSEPMSYRQAVTHIQQRYMLDLADAIFERGDAKLLASAGACTKCPKRTGNQPEIFAGVSADVCTDPDCFAEKRFAHHAATLVQANKKGIPVLEGEEASDVRSRQWTTDSEYVSASSNIYSFARNAPSTANTGSVGSRLKADQLPPAAVYLKSEDGSMVAMFSRPVMQTALEDAGVCETVDVHAARMKDAAANGTPGPKALTAAQAAQQAADRAMLEAAEEQSAFRMALYKAVRARGATNGFCLQSLREFAKLSLGAYSLPSELKDLYQFNFRNRKEVEAHIDQAGLPEIQLLLVDMVVSELLTVSQYDVKNGNHLDDDFAEVIAMARCEYIDPESVMSHMAPVPLSVSKLNAEGVAKLLKSNPFRINEIRRSITTDRPDLVKAMDKAAQALGYKHSMAGSYVRPSEALGTMHAAPAPTPPETGAEGAAAPSSLTATEEVDGDAVAVDGEDLEAAIAEPVPAKSSGKKAAKTAPAPPPAKATVTKKVVGKTPSAKASKAKAPAVKAPYVKLTAEQTTAAMDAHWQAVSPSASAAAEPAESTTVALTAAAGKTVLAPAASWPFPKARDATRDPAAADK